MNLIDYYVKEVLSGPIENPYGWSVICLVEDMGGEKKEEIYCKSWQEAYDIKPGYKGQH